MRRGSVFLGVLVGGLLSGLLSGRGFLLRGSLGLGFNLGLGPGLDAGGKLRRFAGGFLLGGPACCFGFRKGAALGFQGGFGGGAGLVGFFLLPFGDLGLDLFGECFQFREFVGLQVCHEMRRGRLGQGR